MSLERDAAPATDAALAAETPQTEPSEARRVLIVDDVETNLDVLARRLTRAGFETVLALSGQEALERIGERLPDMVLLDWMMPEMSGLEVLEHLRQSLTPDQLPIIMVTAKDSPDAVARALEAGANDYVSKPIDFRVLRARMDGQLQRVDALRALSLVNEDLRAALTARDHESSRATATVVRALQDRRAAERAAGEALLRAEAGLRAKTKFLSLISRELREPIVRILNLADATGGGGALQEGAQAEIWAHADKTRRMLDKILATVDAAADERPVIGSAALENVVGEAIDRVKSAGLHRVAVRVGAFSDVVRADDAALCDALEELIASAVRASEPGSTILVKPEPAHPGRITVMCAGADDAALDLEEDLGANLAKRLIEAQGGRITQSRMGRLGQITAIDLPLDAP